MKAENGSGAATKIMIHAGSSYCAHAEFGWKPDVMSGISAKSLCIPFQATGQHDKLFSVLMNSSIKNFQDPVAFNKEGNVNFTGALRLLTGKPSVTTQRSLSKTLKKNFNRHEFWDFKNSSNVPECFVGATNMRTGKIEYFDLKKLNYDNFIAAIMASSAIPGYVPPVKINNDLYYDGGLIDHIGTTFIYNNFDVSESLNIYSRTSDFDVLDEDYEGKRFAENLLRTIEIMTANVSLDDESTSDMISIISKLGLNSTQKKILLHGLKKHKLISPKIVSNGNEISEIEVFMPYRLTTKGYVWDKALNLKWYNIGYDSCLESFKKSRYKK